MPLASGHVEAVFDGKDAAEAAIEALRAGGFGDRIGVALRVPGAWVEGEGELETGDDVRTAVERGIAAGIPVGVLAGLALVGLAVPGVGTLGVGGVLAAGGIAGALAGTYFGSMLGLAADQHDADDLEPGQVLVVVHGPDGLDDAARLLAEHGGRVVRQS
ncbi:MAG TPA: hypothetical protein ENK55_08275 [Actinobacteria bacterium]|nr:hypothetical protein [Actinomycetota bacterium]